MRAMLAAGELEQRRVELTIERRAVPMMFTGIGMEQMDVDLQGMFEKILPKNTSRRDMTVAEARGVLFEQECDALINQEKVNATAIELAENTGIIFVDELDKIVASEHTHGADVSRQGVQRDLLPIVEGTTVQTRYGYVRTDHILFIAAGAFHRAKPSDLMPELQGRFPIRVELQDLGKADFIRILTEPKGALTKQYQALLETEGVQLSFRDDAVDAARRVRFSGEPNHAKHRRPAALHDHGATPGRTQLRGARQETRPRGNQRGVRQGAPRRIDAGRRPQQVHSVSLHER